MTELARLGLPSPGPATSGRPSRASLLLLPSDSSSNLAPEPASNSTPRRAGRAASCRLSRLLADVSSRERRTPSLSSVVSTSSGFASGGSSKATSEASDCELSLDGDCDSESVSRSDVSAGTGRDSASQEEDVEEEVVVPRPAAAGKRGSDSSDDTVVERRTQPRAASPCRLTAPSVRGSPTNAPTNTARDSAARSVERSPTRPLAGTCCASSSNPEESPAEDIDKAVARSAIEQRSKPSSEPSSKTTSTSRHESHPTESAGWVHEASQKSSNRPATVPVVASTRKLRNPGLPIAIHERLPQTSYKTSSISQTRWKVRDFAESSYETKTCSFKSVNPPETIRSSHEIEDGRCVRMSQCCKRTEPFLGVLKGLDAANQNIEAGEPDFEAPNDTLDIVGNIWPVPAPEAGANDGEHLFGANREQLFDAWLANLERRNRRLADHQLTVLPPNSRDTPSGDAGHPGGQSGGSSVAGSNRDCRAGGKVRMSDVRAAEQTGETPRGEEKGDKRNGQCVKNSNCLSTRRNDGGGDVKGSGNSVQKLKDEKETALCKSKEKQSGKYNDVITKQVELENGTKVEVKMRKRKAKPDKDNSNHKGVAAKVANYSLRQSLPIVPDHRKPKIVGATLKSSPNGQHNPRYTMQSISKNTEESVVEGKLMLDLRKTDTGSTSESAKSNRNTLHFFVQSKGRAEPIDPASSRSKAEKPGRGHVTFKSALRFFQDQSVVVPGPEESEAEAVELAAERPSLPEESPQRPATCAAQPASADPRHPAQVAATETDRAGGGAAPNSSPVPPPRRRGANRIPTTSSPASLHASAKPLPASVPPTTAPPASPSQSSPKITPASASQEQAPSPPPPPPVPAGANTAGPVAGSKCASMVTQRRAKKASAGGAARSSQSSTSGGASAAGVARAHPLSGMDSVIAELKSSRRERPVSIEGSRVPRLADKDSVLMELQSVQEGRSQRPSRPSAAPSRRFRRLQCEFSDATVAEEFAADAEGNMSVKKESSATKGRASAEEEYNEVDVGSHAYNGISSKDSLSTESGFSEEEPA